MQLLLTIAKTGNPQADTWERLDAKARSLFLDALTRAIAKAVRPELFVNEGNHHDR